MNTDLWPDYIRGALLCSWLGHRFVRPKMYDMVCTRCSASRPRTTLEEAYRAAKGVLVPGTLRPHFIRSAR